MVLLDGREISKKEALRRVFDAIESAGYDPVKQLSEYILSEDPIYIPNVEGARALIRQIDRADILSELILEYFK